MSLALNKNLTDKEFRVIYLLKAIHTFGAIRRSPEELGKLLGKTAPAIRRVLDALEKKNFITKSGKRIFIREDTWEQF